MYRSKVIIAYVILPLKKQADNPLKLKSRFTQVFSTDQAKTLCVAFFCKFEQI